MVFAIVLAVLDNAIRVLAKTLMVLDDSWVAFAEVKDFYKNFLPFLADAIHVLAKSFRVSELTQVFV